MMLLTPQTFPARQTEKQIAANTNCRLAYQEGDKLTLKL